jgi:hypothetical protein
MIADELKGKMNSVISEFKRQ